MVDGMFAGQALGHVGMAALTVAAPFITVLTAVVMLIGDGATSVMALKLGEGDAKGAPRVLGNAVVMMFAAAVLVAAIALPLLDVLLAAAGADAQTLPLARTYLQIAIGGTVLLGFSLGIDTFLRTLGFPNRTLAVQVVCAAVNIVLDYAFVMEGGFGLAGAAWASVLGQAAGAAVTVALLLRRDMPFRLRAADFRPDAHIIGRSLALGAPSFILKSSDALTNFILHALVLSLGAASALDGMTGGLALAVVGANARISSFLMVPAIGIAVAARPLIGYCHGAGLRERERRIVRCALLAGGCVMTAFWLVVELFPAPIMGLFGFAEASLPFATWALRVQVLAAPLLIVRVVGTNYFQAAGHAVRANVLMVFQQIVFLIPFIAAAPAVLPAFLPLDALQAVFAGIVAADVASTALTAVFLGRALVRR